MKTYKHKTKEIYYGAYFSKTLKKVIVQAFSTRKIFKVKTIPLDAIKCSKNEFYKIKNKYYVSKRFEWIFKNELYETCQLEETIQLENSLYNALVWHCGEVFKAYFRSDDKIFLETNTKGKFTSKNNCLGIRKINENY